MHFHISASQTALTYFGTTFWPSQDDYVKPAIGESLALPEQLAGPPQQRYSEMFDRHPDREIVSRREWHRWVPFMLEAMDYELEGNAPEWFDKLQKLPSAYFRDNWYATFWFETGRGDLQHLVDAVGEDNVMFETDFPHPTCLHPNPVELVSEKVASLRPETQRKIMGENAVKLYRLSPTGA